MKKVIIAVLIVLGALIEVAPHIVEAGGRWCPRCVIGDPWTRRSF